MSLTQNEKDWPALILIAFASGIYCIASYDLEK